MEIRIRLKQTNKTYKCLNCKNIYLEYIIKKEHNGYCNMMVERLKCNKCFAEFMLN